MARVYRQDRGEIRSPYVSHQGHLRADGVATRVGVFMYRDSETGEIYGELRHPDEVFKPESLQTLGGLPLTFLHPTEFVTPENYKDYGVGTLGDEVIVDNPFVKVVLNVQRDDGVNAIAQGVQELSCGYFADSVPEEGTYDGIPYKYRQTNIQYNHLAIVPKGRAGPAVRINLDSFDLDNIAIQQEEPVSTTQTPTQTQLPLSGVLALRIDEDSTIQLEPAQHQLIANRFKRDADRIAELEGSVASLKQDLDSAKAATAEPKTDQQIIDAGFDDVASLVAAHTEATAKVEELQGKLDARPSFSADEFEAKVRDRIALERKCEDAGLPEKFNLATASDRELKEAVILASSEKIDADTLKAKSDDYIEARFDAVMELKETQPAPKQDSTIPLRIASSKAQQTVATPVMDEAEAARQEMIANRTRRAS